MSLALAARRATSVSAYWRIGDLRVSSIVAIAPDPRCRLLISFVASSRMTISRRSPSEVEGRHFDSLIY